MQGQPGSSSGSPAPEATRKFYIPDIYTPASVLTMILLAELLVMIYTLVSSELPSFDWHLAASSSLFTQWIVLTSAWLLSRNRQRLGQISLPLAAFFSLVTVMLVTLAASLVGIYALPELVFSTAPGWWILKNLIVSVLLSGIVLRYFFLLDQLRLKEKVAVESQLESLRGRIRPHFLFNTLNSIASLIASRPERAEKAVEDLAELFRASLKEDHGKTDIADELHLCKLYLDIEQMRLGDRLSLEWDIQPGIAHEPMPSLLLQPLVENAIGHGIALLPEGGTVTIQIQSQGEFIHVILTNPTPENGSSLSGNKLALTTTRQRLMALFGTAATLSTQQSDKQFCARLSYPKGFLP